MEEAEVAVAGVTLAVIPVSAAILKANPPAALAAPVTEVALAAHVVDSNTYPLI